MAVKIIKAPAGLGKTRMVLDLITQTVYGKIEYYVPTHELADELAEALRQLPLPPHLKVIQGRDRPHAVQDHMCKRHVLAKQLSDKMYPVYPVLCRKRDDKGGSEFCEYYDRCPYIEQFQGPDQVYIYTHFSLALERGALEEGIPGLVIIDESFFRSCIEEVPIPLSDLFDTTLGPNTQAVGQAVVKTLLAGKPLLMELRAAGMTDAIQSALKESGFRLPGFSPWWTDKRQAKAIGDLPERSRVQDLLECLSVELAMPRDESHSVTFDKRAGKIKLHRRKKITRFSDSKRASDIVILDASADPTIIEPWFPGAELVELRAPRNAFVTQCSSARGSTTSLVPEKNKDAASRATSENRLEDLQHLIDRKSAGGKKVLVVGPSEVTGNPSKNVPALVRAGTGGELAHFNALRGIDRFKDFDTAIIVGRNQPGIEAVEALARCIWYDSPEPLGFAADWVIEERGYRVRGQALPTGVGVIVHPDRRIQAVLEQLRENETTQAVDRLRLIHADTPKEIILLSSIPVDIDVDRLLSWAEITRGTRLEEAWGRMNGVLPLEPGWLFKTFPDLWKSEPAVKQDVEGAVQKYAFSNYISVSNSILLPIFYRPAGQRRRSHALSALPLAETMNELARLLGAPVALRDPSGANPDLDHQAAMGGGELGFMRAQGTAIGA